MRVEAALGQSRWSPGGRFTLQYLNGWTLDPVLYRIWYHFMIHIICLNLSLLDRLSYVLSIFPSACIKL